MLIGVVGVVVILLSFLVFRPKRQVPSIGIRLLKL